MNRVRTLVGQILRLPSETVTAETAMATTDNWDSLRHMELIVAIEESFGIQLDGDEIAAMRSVAAIEGVLAAKGVTTS